LEPLTLEQARLKAAAVACYSSQAPGGAHITSEVVGMAAAIGAVRGLEYAEQYALLKEVR
jgi:N-acetylglucosamine malate deacetylase 1